MVFVWRWLYFLQDVFELGDKGIGLCEWIYNKLKELTFHKKLVYHWTEKPIDKQDTVK